MKSRALLELKSVTKSYLSGHIRSVGIVDVSMTVPMQAMMALAGPSGSGKTTLLNLIGLLDSPDEGTIQFEGSAIQNLTPGKAAIFRNQNIGFVFQDFNLLPVLTALENVEVALLERSITSAQKTNCRYRNFEACRYGKQVKLHPSSTFRRTATASRDREGFGDISKVGIGRRTNVKSRYRKYNANHEDHS